jgi:carbon storage regulator
VLSITRRVGERIVIGDDIVLHVQEVSGSTVRIGIEAPQSLRVYREEIWASVKEENARAAASPAELPKGPLPVSSNETPDSDEETSGMPEGEPELAPMGIDSDEPVDADEHDRDEEELPGFPAEGEPDVSG